VYGSSVFGVLAGSSAPKLILQANLWLETSMTHDSDGTR
jgi:hypothetical protein